jgi:DNA-binding beta-propeller fold protein YncE
MHKARRLPLALAAALAFGLVAAAGPAQAFTYVNSFGSLGSGDGQFHFVNQIAVDPAGSIYAADGNNERIEKFSPGGSFLAQFGGPGDGDGQFAGVYGVAVDPTGSFVYATDGGTHNRVNEYTTGGSFVRSWGATGTGDGEFNLPSGVAVAPSGDVYVGDNSNDRVEEFTSTGAFVRKWGTTGSGDGQLMGPDGVAVDSAGHVWVTEDQNHRLQEFTASGGFIRVVTSVDGEPFGGPFAISLDSAGHVWVSDEKAVEELDGSGSFIAAYSGGTGATAFSELNGLAVDCHGVYAADGDLDRIELFSEPSIPACPGPAPASTPPATPAGAPPAAAPALSLALVAAHSQRVLKQHGILLNVAAGVASTIVVTGSIAVPGARRAVKFSRTQTQLAPGAQRTLKLKLSRKALKLVSKALHRHRSLRAKVTLAARDSAGKVVTSRRTVRLTR